MGCLSEREKGEPEQTAKWDYLTLTDFRCTSFWTILAYIWLWFLALIGIAVYGVDIFTAVNLLAFDRWSSQVKPALDFKYSKWIFAICICLSWALCFYEWFRAIRVMRRGGVAESFLDPLAVNVQSMRPKGFKRFLVFNALTKSRKGADYVALFVYFSFQTAIRVILAEGPRIGVNAMTLYAVLQADLVPAADADHSPFEQFFVNIGALWDKDHRQAMIYFSMLFTLVIWVFSALSLIASAVLYITFLWHYIPQRDGSLVVYCRRKVDKRLEIIVSNKVQKAIEDEEREKRKEEEKAELKRQKTGELAPPATRIGIKKQPTLPNLGTPEVGKDDKLPEFTLRRQGTDSSISTLPPYSSQPPTRDGSNRLQRQPTLPDVGEERPGMTRTNTSASAWSNAPSYATEAPLLHNANMPGESEPPLPPLPPEAIMRQGSYASFQQPWHERTGSQSSQNSARSFTPGPRAQTPMSTRPFTPGVGPGYPRAPPLARGPTPMRTMIPQAYDQEPKSASTYQGQDMYNRPLGAPMRSNTGGVHAGPKVDQAYWDSTHQRQPLRSNTAGGFHTGPKVDETYWNHMQQQKALNQSIVRQPFNPSFSRPYSPATVQVPPQQQQQSYEMTLQPAHSIPVSRTPAGGGYVAFNPSASTSATPALSDPAFQGGPCRNITVAGGHGADNSYFGGFRQVPQRSATAPIEPHYSEPMQSSVSEILDDYGYPSSSSSQSIQRPQQPTNPLQQRSNTAGPPAGAWRRY